MTINYSELLLQNVKDYAIIYLDKNGLVLYTNDAVLDIKGYSAKELLGHFFDLCYLPEEKAHKKGQLELQIACKYGRHEDDGWKLRKDGTRYWSNYVITAIYDDDKQLTGFSLIVRDNTEKKLLEQAFRASEERYRLLVEGVKDYGICMLDTQGAIVSWNEGAKRLNGYSSYEVIGKPFSIFYTTEDINTGAPERDLIVATEAGRYDIEGWRVKKDGSKFWANVLITALYNMNELVGFSQVTRDLTERKIAEEALKKSERRYKALAAELQKNNKAIEHTNAELGQYTSIVSHDLQEPLRTIHNYLELIQMKLQAEGRYDLENYISKAISGSKKMKELIVSLLNYTQLDKNRLEIQEVSVSKLLEEVFQNLDSLIENSEAVIHVQISFDTIWGDKLQLSQLFQNLLVNAIKFVEDNKPEITITGVETNGEYLFNLIDNGIGIKEEFLERIFEIFRRVAGKRSYQGTGIGLAICKKIVERHGGTITAHSKPGEGTTFRFSIKKDLDEQTEDTNS